MKPTVVFVDIEDRWEIDYLTGLLCKQFEVKFFKEPADLALDKINDAVILSTFIQSKVDKKVIEAIPGLRLITTRSTGFDHIDIGYARSRGITVSNVPTYGENTVAEHAFALILSLARNLKKAHARAAEGDFSIKDLMGFDLKGKTIGVIGTGHIGLRAIKMAVGFGMNVLAYDPMQNHFLEEVLGFKYAELETLLKESDVITLHAPLNDKTHHLINNDNIGLIKRGAILINTARGGLIETTALIRALDEGILSGAGLDVLEDEDVILEEKQLLLRRKKELYNPQKLQSALRASFLLQRDNVIFTPHIGFYSREALQRILDITVYNISKFIEKTPVNVVNRPPA